MWYHKIRNVVFFVFWGTLLRPTAGAVVLIPKCTTLQSVPWLCASIPEESYAISLWSSTATSAVNISNRAVQLPLDWSCEFAVSSGGPGIIDNYRNPNVNLASDSATAGLAWVRVCALWRPGASVRRTQAERWLQLYCGTPCVGMIFTKPRFQ